MKPLRLLREHVPAAKFVELGLLVFRKIKARKKRKEEGNMNTNAKAPLQSLTVRGLLVTFGGGLLTYAGFTLEEANEVVTLLLTIVGAVVQLTGLYAAWRGRKRATQPLA